MRVSSPIFIPATKGGWLAAEIKREAENLGKVMGWSYKVVERGGRMLKELLTKSNLFSKEKCERNDCFACKDAGKEFDC